MQYHEPVFRPPAEANSIILQVVHGCKWNNCHFCEMYSSKSFTIRSISAIKDDIDYLAKYYSQSKRLFIGDGDIFSLGYNNTLNVLQYLKEKLPWLNRISAYASSKELLQYSAEQLKSIREAGLSLLYIGIESGDDATLKLINKGIKASQQLEALNKAKSSGYRLSVMILNGLGGKRRSRQHALASAQLLNQIQPELLSFLTVSYPLGFEHFKNKLRIDFEALSPLELAQEVRLIIAELELCNTVFRSDHVSNLMPLKGGLNRDKDRLLSELDQLIRHLGSATNSYINESPNL